MFQVKVLNNIAKTSLNQFPKELYKIAVDCENPDAILVRSAHLLDAQFPASLKVIGRAGAGVNNIPVKELSEKGIPVFNTPGANANAVKELVVAGMLLASRHILKANHFLTQLESNSEEDFNKMIEQQKKEFSGSELYGKTLGIVGLGSIGVKVANTGIHLGMKVLGYDPQITVKNAWELSSSVLQAQSLNDLLMQSDYISFHVPLTPETRDMMQALHFKLLKPNAVILNFSRNGIINEPALLDAIQHQPLLYYVNDFPSLKLKNNPQIISLPHLGASTLEAEENCAMMIVKQVREFLEKGTISYSVNFPSAEMPYMGGKRLAIANQNIPNMVAQISSELASNGLNILGLLNKSKDNLAYTLIDVDQDVPDIVLSKIAKVNGILQIRYMGELPMISHP